MSPRLPALLVLFFLAACGSSAKTNFYALEPLPSAQPVSAQGPDTPVSVDRVELPAMLDRLSLVTEGPGNRISVSDTDRWAAPLDERDSPHVDRRSAAAPSGGDSSRRR